MTHDEAREAMPLFVVDADDPATRAALLRHVEGCDSCRGELTRFQLAADALGRCVPQIDPRPELRARTLASVAGTHAHDTAAAQLRRAHPLVASAPAAVAVPPARPGGWAPWLAAAATLAAAAATAGLLQTRAELSQLRAALVEGQARAAAAERVAQASQATLVTYRRQLDVMTADDLLLVSLGGLPPAGTAQAKAFVTQSLDAILFTARDLPPLPADRVYQLWVVVAGQTTSAGTFEPDANGRSQLVADVPALTARPDAVSVTVEPEGGVPAPTGPRYLLGVPAP